ncbi:hypothetical protein V1514DRAFT_333423 [Lipomyces japonicus]|uniref:uncharacterized protein n=1 Tax=Lipomyces japonicus TaxID=56871 RepID=UPI0034CEB0A4
MPWMSRSTTLPTWLLTSLHGSATGSTPSSRPSTCMILNGIFFLSFFFDYSLTFLNSNNFGKLDQSTKPLSPSPLRHQTSVDYRANKENDGPSPSRSLSRLASSPLSASSFISKQAVLPAVTEFNTDHSIPSPNVPPHSSTLTLTDDPVDPNADFFGPHERAILGHTSHDSPSSTNFDDVDHMSNSSTHTITHDQDEDSIEHSSASSHTLSLRSSASSVSPQTQSIPQDASFKSATASSPASNHSSFYSANNSSQKVTIGYLPAVLANLPGPLAQSTPSASTPTRFSPPSSAASASLASPTNRQNLPSQDSSVKIQSRSYIQSSPRQLYPTIPDRIAISQRSPVASPKTPREPHPLRNTVTVPLKASPDHAQQQPPTPQHAESTTFASLPAKAPLTTKKSIAKRTSGFSFESNKSSNAFQRTSSVVDPGNVQDDHQLHQLPKELQGNEPQAQIQHSSSNTTPVAKQMTNSSKNSSNTEISSNQSVAEISSKKTGEPSVLPFLYKNLHDMINNDPQEEDEEDEDWIPLSKATPAPRSRYMAQLATGGNLPVQNSFITNSVQPDKIAEIEEDEEKEEQPETTAEKTVRPTTSQTQLKQSPVKRYQTLTASSVSKSRIPTTSTTSESNSLPASPTRKPLIASPNRFANRSPVRTMPKPSPQRSPIRDSKFQKYPIRGGITGVGGIGAASTIANTGSESRVVPSRPSGSPVRMNSTLSRQGSISTNTATALAAATASHAASHSPVASAFKNMKLSTTDMFRKARLLFNNNNNSNSGAGHSTEFNSVKNLEDSTKLKSSLTSPAKKPNTVVISDNINKSLYPDISDFAANLEKSPQPKSGLSLNERGSSRYSGLGTAVTTNINNPAKVLFPTSGARLAQRPGQSRATLTSSSGQSYDDAHDIGDLHLSPEVKSLSTIAPTATTTTTTAAASQTTRDKLGRPKRTKSTIRKPPSRAKQAPVVVRVPMGAQRELDHQRKFAAAAAAVQTPTGPQRLQLSLPDEDENNEEEQRKAEQKREIERRRQENTRRALADAKKDEEEEVARQRFTAVKRQSRVQQRPQADESKQLKRNFLAETDAGKLKTSIVPNVANDQSKRRRTNEIAGSPVENKISHSVSRKEGGGNGFVARPAPQPNLMKTVVTQQGMRTVPYVEAVKFSNEKIRFGATASASTRTSTGTGTGTGGTTPGRSNLSSHVVNVSQQQQLGPNSHRLSQLAQIQANSGDHIALPEICSESEDDDESSVILDWAHSPALREALRSQQSIDPDTVFGPIAPLQMEEVFKRNGIPNGRFRPRSSSANWSNNDRLTPQEIAAYASDMGYQNNNNSRKE